MKKNVNNAYIILLTLSLRVAQNGVVERFRIATYIALHVVHRLTFFYRSLQNFLRNRENMFYALVEVKQHNNK